MTDEDNLSIYDYPRFTSPETWRQVLQTSGNANITGLPVSNSSLALSNSIVAKAGPGTLFGASILNTKISAQFIQVFDAAAVPADGAVPVAVYTVGASSNLGLYWGSVGRWHNIGIVLCNSSTAATKTIGSADCFFDVQYF